MTTDYAPLTLPRMPNAWNVVIAPPEFDAQHSITPTNRKGDDPKGPPPRLTVPQLSRQPER